MRVVMPLDEGTVGSAADAARSSARAAQMRPWLWLLSPFLGFAPAAWQRRWRDTWDFPATLATWLSAFLEVAVGTIGVMELLSAMAAGEPIFPWLPRPLVYFGLVLFVEGLIRLAQLFSDSGPVGSVFGLVVAVFERPPPPIADPVPAPSVKAFDETSGLLELVSPIQRRDWEAPGRLPYRGDLFTLEATSRIGERWVYRFARVEVADDEFRAVHRLLPPRSKAAGRSIPDHPGVVETVLLSVACTMAPRRFQERWAGRFGIRAEWFTVIGATAELIGGLSNLGAGRGGEVSGLLLNLFFVVEALVRMASVVFKGAPLGSLFGLPLAPLLEWRLPEPGSQSDESLTG